jgi:CHASE3 domain sensor protein
VGAETPADLRVLLAIASLLALLAVAVLAAVFLIVELRNDTNRLTDRQVRYVEAIHDAALHAKGTANDERGFLISGRQQFLNQLEDRTVKAQAAFDVATRTATGPGQELAVEEARIGFDRWLKALRAEIALYKAGDRKRAIATSLGRTRALRKDYERALALADVLGVGAVQTATTSVSATSTRSVTILLVYLACALVIGGAVALWVVRAVLRPAHALLRLADENARTIA